VVFVDVQSFISLSERLPLAEVVARLNRFYKIAADAVFELDGTFEKAVGDQAMAFFGVGFRHEDRAQRAISAALWVVKTLEDIMDDNESLQVGGGVRNGEAFIDNVPESEVQDFTAIGDIANTAARLQSLSELGDVVIMEETYRWLREKFPDDSQRSVEVKGKPERVAIRTLNVWAAD
jgi:adenylate cyclase